MSYYSVLEVTPTSDEWIADYIDSATHLVTQYGGKYLARTANHECLEGQSDKVGLRIIIEWPTKACALAFMADPTYQPHLQARTKGSISHHFLIEGKDDLD
ncbi:DUF1330 domain-containing protein [Aliikangiella marina]|uniref:DUF1330 domain-containing protein n=1 Tax=Aliikangiella marina TaxID=1712262 RepID=A0A545TDC0_9GAMM|nr:DUF1330 domain-containing protein [Aliikangiella marina]TQV75210.1 DUF1330 domain-containing protein [Aliikangiella marina]